MLCARGNDKKEGSGNWNLSRARTKCVKEGGMDTELDVDDLAGQIVSRARTGLPEEEREREEKVSGEVVRTARNGVS